MTQNQGRDRQSTGAEEHLTAKTQGWEVRTLTGSATPGRPLGWQGQTVEEYRRAKADRAIARIEERYQRGLTIPEVR